VIVASNLSRFLADLFFGNSYRAVRARMAAPTFGELLKSMYREVPRG